MALAFRAIGTVVANIGSGNMASVPLPTGHIANDILICIVTAGDNIVCTMPAGWTRKIGVNNGTIARLEIWWKRDSGSESAPTVTHAAGDSASAFIAAYSGVASSLSDPFRDAQTQVTATSLTCTAPALTGVVSGDFRIFVGGFGATDTSGTATNNWTTVTSFTERIDTLNGAGGHAASAALDDLLATGAAGSITSTITWGGAANPNNIGAQLALSSSTGFTFQQLTPPGQELPREFFEKVEVVSY